jgi:hypothetical protein
MTRVEGPIQLSRAEKILAWVGLLIVLFMLLAIFVLPFYPCLIPMDRNCKEQRFQPCMQEYASLAGLPQSAEQAYITGPFAVVDIGEAINDEEDYYYLPQRLSPLHFNPEVKGEADKPEEVKTVILLNWGKELVGKYGTSGVKAYRPTCEVIVVDRARRAVVGREFLRGSEPPESRILAGPRDTRFAGVFGSTPWREIVAYIQRLPRRQPTTAASGSSRRPVL